MVGGGGGRPCAAAWRAARSAAAFSAAARRSGPALGLRTGRSSTQVGQQCFQRLGVLAQRLFLLALVLEALVQRGHGPGAIATVGFQRRSLLLLVLVRALQLLLALGDLRLQRFQLLQVSGQRGDALCPLALQVTMVGQGTIRIGHGVLRQQQFQRCVVAQLIGRAQQPGQFAVLLGQVALQGAAALLGLGQGLGLLAQCRLGLRKRAPGACHLLVGLAQLLRRLPALALDLPSLLRHALQFGAQLLQLALGLAGGLRSTRQWQGQRHGQPQQQAATAAGSGDVMSA